MAHVTIRRTQQRVRRSDASEVEIPQGETFVQLLSHNGVLLMVTWESGPPEPVVESPVD